MWKVSVETVCFMLVLSVHRLTCQTGDNVLPSVWDVLMKLYLSTWSDLRNSCLNHILYSCELFSHDWRHTLQAGTLHSLMTMKNLNCHDVCICENERSTVNRHIHSGFNKWSSLYSTVVIGTFEHTRLLVSSLDLSVLRMIEWTVSLPAPCVFLSSAVPESHYSPTPSSNLITLWSHLKASGSQDARSLEPTAASWPNYRR